MGRSWSHAARMKDRVRACRWDFEPEIWKVRVDDTYDRTRHTMAARFLVMAPAEYLLWCAAYVFRHHRDLAPVRAEIRKWDREEKAEQRRRAAERKESEARWDAVPRKRPQGATE